ncbi:MAG: GatB/YqeY domain-containing protein, partial [Bacteroidaceae bacterium]|nr:GatB/YqeY domain-containing protein [Bacteroidaceae bacterium]
ATSPRDMGKVMGVASKQLAGKADGKAIADTVKKLLSE